MNEAFLDFEMIYNQVQKQPVKPFINLRYMLVTLVTSGLKLLVFQNKIHDLCLPPALKVKIESLNTTLTELRITREEDYSLEQLMRIKRDILQHFEKVRGQFHSKTIPARTS